MNTLGFRPGRGLVLVYEEKPREQTEEGIIIPVQAQLKPCRGVVVAVGPPEVMASFREPGFVEVPPPVRVGDVVLYLSFAGTRLDLEAIGRKDLEPHSFLVLSPRDEIIAVLEGEDKPEIELPSLSPEVPCG